MYFAQTQIKSKKNRQAALWETPSNPATVAELDGGITDFTLSKLFAFKFRGGCKAAQDPQHSKHIATIRCAFELEQVSWWLTPEHL